MSALEAPPSQTSVTLQILSIVLYTFIAFICIGLPIAVLPGYVHDQLGYGAVIAGLTIGSQYLATLLTRPTAGRIADTQGTKRAIVLGLSGIFISGALTLAATLLSTWPALALGLLLAGRLVLGIAQGLIGVGTNSWGIAQLGSTHMARVISWNGIASYGAIAIGAPLGVGLVGHVGFNVLGAALMGLAALGLLVIRRKPSMPVVRGERLSFWSAFARVAPYGLSLNLASIGYGTLTTFVTLFYLERGWDGAAWCLSVFGACFIVGRLVFIGAINRFGGFNVALTCLAVETVGLILLWLAPNVGMALTGAALAGLGLSLMYPALGVEAIKQVPVSSRGAGLGAYSVFFDLALAVSGPLMGALAVHFGYGSAFACSAVLALCGVGLVAGLRWRRGATG